MNAKIPTGIRIPSLFACLPLSVSEDTFSIRTCLNYYYYKRKLTKNLTYNRENDHHKIKNVPSNGEIVTVESNELQYTFSSV